MKGASSADTRSAIVDLVRSHAPVSRIALSELSGLTEASISKIVRTLIDEGLVRESGFAQSTGGKRPVLLELNSSSRCALGVSLDYSRITLVICDIHGTVMHRHHLEGVRSRRPQTVVPRLAKGIERFLDKHQINRGDVIGIGVSDAGRLDGTGVLRASRMSEDWEQYALEETLSEAVGLPVLLENDANCAALAEFWSGGGAAAGDFVSLYMASGVGLGLIIDGDMYRGTSSNAGEIGHLQIDPNGPPCICGSVGCLEVLATPAALVRQVGQDPELCERWGLPADHDQDTRAAFAAITTAAATGDDKAIELIRLSAARLAMAVIGLANILDLDRIYLSGPGFAVAGQLYLEVISDSLNRLAYMRHVHPITVSLGDTTSGAAARGAAVVVLHSQLTPHHRRG